MAKTEDVERLARLEVGQESMHDDVRLIKRCLMGNGREGLVIRVDRLEESDKARKVIHNAGWIVVLALAIERVWPLIFT